MRQNPHENLATPQAQTVRAYLTDLQNRITTAIAEVDGPREGRPKGRRVGGG